MKAAQGEPQGFVIGVGLVPEVTRGGFIYMLESIPLGAWTPAGRAFSYAGATSVNQEREVAIRQYGFNLRRKPSIKPITRSNPIWLDNS